MGLSSPDLTREGVVFPGSLVDAARDGTLVIFAGAGISRGKPARYPDFEELVDQLTEGMFQERREGEAPDAFLGRVEPEQSRRQMGELARQYFLDNCKITTPIHHVLLRLFPARDSVRIVTTNYDELFEQVGHGLPVWSAPALPRGDDFHGIVHLHGRARDPNSRIVITDRDFGEAYLSEGWARDFIVELYRTHPVLFVGYSHSDVVTTYLAKGIGSGPHPKFALVAPAKEGEKETDWKALGVTRIEYPNEAGDHSILRSTLQAWAEYARRSEVRHELTLQAALSNNRDEVDLDTLSEIRRAVAHPSRVRYFTRHAAGMPWVRWAMQEEFLDPLVGKEASVQLNAGELVLWIGRQAQGPGGPSLRALLTGMGGEIGDELRGQITRTLWGKQDLSAEDLLLWSPVLLRPPTDVELLRDILEMTRRVDVADLALVTLEEILRPHLSLGKDLFRGAFAMRLGEPVPEEADRVEVVTPVEREEHLRDVFDTVRWLLDKQDVEVDGRLAQLATHHLARGHELYRAAGEGWEHGNDLWSYGLGNTGGLIRDDDYIGSGRELLLRLAREVHDTLLDRNPTQAAVLREGWASSGKPILLHLALEVERAMGDSDKVLDFVAVHPGLFRLYGALESVRDAVVDNYGEATPDSQRRIEEVLLAEAEAGAASARTTARLTGVPLPGLGLGGQPATREGANSAMLDVSVDELIQTPIPEVVHDLEDAFAQLGDAPQGELARSVSEAVVGEPGWALKVVNHLAGNGRWSSPLWKPLIWGAINAPIGAEVSQSMLVRLAELPVEAALPEQVRLAEVVLWSQVQGTVARASAHIIGRAFPNEEEMGSAVKALLRLLEGVREGAYDVDVNDLLERLGNAVDTSKATREAVGRNLGDLYEEASEWCDEHVLPLLKQGNHHDHERTADVLRGALEGDARFLPASVLGVVAKAVVGHIDELVQERKQQSVLMGNSPCERAVNSLSDSEQRAVSVFVAAAKEAVEDPFGEWLGPLVQTEKDAVLAFWTQRMGGELRTRPDLARRVWHSWGRRYLERRVVGLPVPLSGCEVRGLFDWIASVPPDEFSEAVALFERAPQSAPPWDEFLRRPIEAGLYTTHPEAFARLLILAISAGSTPGWWRRRIEDAVRHVAQQATPSWPQLVDALMLSGYATADDIESWTTSGEENGVDHASTT